MKTEEDTINRLKGLVPCPLCQHQSRPGLIRLRTGHHEYEFCPLCHGSAKIDVDMYESLKEMEESVNR